jgi:hypothetical protein
VEVVDIATSGANSPPNPITLRFEPTAPRVGDALAAYVGTSLTLDDPDYDVVRYEYVWSVDGEIVRQVTTAAHSDLLKRSLLKNGESVSCRVTPWDNVSAGPESVIAAPIGESGVPAMGTWALVVLAQCIAAAGTIVVARGKGTARPRRT